MNFDELEPNDVETGKLLFAEAKKNIPSVDSVFESAITKVLGEKSSDAKLIKASFSQLVADCQDEAYTQYLVFEKSACGAALKQHVLKELGANLSGEQVLEFVANNFGAIDRFCLSLTQSRRPRAGKTFEMTVSALFESLGYPYTEQPELGDSKPDYVLPNIEWYKTYASDCIVFTCKRTLRERWRQVVTEGQSGQNFYLATIDEKLSGAELKRMQDRHVKVVVPEKIKTKHYSDALNVISFEDFFQHHLDPALIRWKSQDAI